MSRDKTAALAEARTKRSLEKRRAVEEAISTLNERNEPITFKSIAILAGVSRPYLYNNFKNAISEMRQEGRQASVKIDGTTVPLRTAEEYQHVEALLRKKLESMKKEIGSVRSENARLKLALERERGRSEHFHKNWIAAQKK